MADVKQREVRGMADSLASDIKPKAYRPVSYTHLTLPTN